MSKGKWTNPRTDKKVQVGGKMKPDLAEWVKQNGGFPTVEKAVELYKKSIEDKTMSIQVFAKIYGTKTIFIINNKDDAEKLLSCSQNSAKDDGLENWDSYGVTLANMATSVVGIKNISISNDGDMIGCLCTDTDDITDFFESAQKGARHDD
jgi:hypothetical protein